jgi:hypothetical protein
MTGDDTTTAQAPNAKLIATTQTRIEGAKSDV